MRLKGSLKEFVSVELILLWLVRGVLSDFHFKSNGVHILNFPNSLLTSSHVLQLALVSISLPWTVSGQYIWKKTKNENRFPLIIYDDMTYISVHLWITLCRIFFTTGIEDLFTIYVYLYRKFNYHKYHKAQSKSKQSGKWKDGKINSTSVQTKKAQKLSWKANKCKQCTPRKYWLSHSVVQHETGENCRNGPVKVLSKGFMRVECWECCNHSKKEKWTDIRLHSFDESSRLVSNSSPCNIRRCLTFKSKNWRDERLNCVSRFSQDIKISADMMNVNWQPCIYYLTTILIIRIKKWNLQTIFVLITFLFANNPEGETYCTYFYCTPSRLL